MPKHIFCNTKQASYATMVVYMYVISGTKCAGCAVPCHVFNGNAKCEVPSISTNIYDFQFISSHRIASCAPNIQPPK
jgi:hypothetical protein